MTSVLDGVMLLWFLLAAASLLFVAIDIKRNGSSSALSVLRKRRRCAG